MKFVKIISLTLLFLLLSSITAYARFNDIPSTHYAFEAISWVSAPANGEIMLGDAQNNFNPGRLLSRFEASIAFARAAGFRQNVEAQAASWERFGSVVIDMAANQPRWQNIANREIAFLLYKGIVTQLEVTQFTTPEAVGHITREEAAVWLVRLMGLSAEVAAFSVPDDLRLNDHANITPSRLLYVYYIYSNGFMQAPNGNINPRGSVARSHLAILFFNALRTAPAAGTPGIIAQNFIIQGTIISMIGSTQIEILTGGLNQRYSFAQNVIIMVNGARSTTQFLQPNMTVSAIVNTHNQIISLSAGGLGAAPPSIIRDRTIEGILTDLQADIIEITTPAEEVHRLYVLLGTTFTRGGYGNLSLGDLRVGDTVSASMEYTRLIHVDAYGELTTIEGTITEIRIMLTFSQITVLFQDGNTGVYIIRPDRFDVYRLRVGKYVIVNLDSLEVLNIEY